MGQLGPKRGQKEVLGHFHLQNALVFADFAYYDSELWYLVASAGQSGTGSSQIRHPIFCKN